MAAAREVFAEDGFVAAARRRLRNWDNEPDEIKLLFERLFLADDIEEIPKIFDLMYNHRYMFDQIYIYCGDSHLQPAHTTDARTNEDDQWDGYLQIWVQGEHPMHEIFNPDTPVKFTEVVANGLNDCEYTRMYLEVPKSKREKRGKSNPVEGYTYGSLEDGYLPHRYAMVICPTSLEFNLPADREFMTSHTFYDLDNRDLIGMDLDDINVLTQLLFHEYTHYDPGMAPNSGFEDHKYGFVGSVDLILEARQAERTGDAGEAEQLYIEALTNANSYTYFAVALRLEKYHWNTGSAVPVDGHETPPHNPRAIAAA
ncbi:hypothetical protein K440DRAFT_643830 [Wilcoxina mikolae CBS 423.85]|nr:hypothetical protein K440DRAFT_643830 [Wilcoxina mikolae CBS 423.85]